MDTGGGWILRDLRSESLGSVTGVSVQEVILAQRPDEEMKNAAPVSGLPGDAPADGTCTGPHRTEVAGPISADQQHNAPDATSASSAAVATSTSSCHNPGTWDRTPEPSGHRERPGISGMERAGKQPVQKKVQEIRHLPSNRGWLIMPGRGSPRKPTITGPGPVRNA